MQLSLLICNRSIMYDNLAFLRDHIFTSLKFFANDSSKCEENSNPSFYYVVTAKFSSELLHIRPSRYHKITKHWYHTGYSPRNKTKIWFQSHNLATSITSCLRWIQWQILKEDHKTALVDPPGRYYERLALTGILPRKIETLLKFLQKHWEFRVSYLCYWTNALTSIRRWMMKTKKTLNRFIFKILPQDPIHWREFGRTEEWSLQSPVAIILTVLMKTTDSVSHFTNEQSD